MAQVLTRTAVVDGHPEYDQMARSPRVLTELARTLRKSHELWREPCTQSITKEKEYYAANSYLFGTKGTINEKKAKDHD
jgi:hypothetical protein